MLRRSLSVFATQASVASGAAAASSSTAAPKVRPDYSELAGPQNVPVLDQLAGYYVNIQSRKLYYKDALRMEHQAVRWAYSDVRKNAEALAQGLLCKGLRPAESLLTVQPCNIETYMMQLACAKIGALCAIVPHQDITGDKLRLYLNMFQPRHFVGREWIAVPEGKGKDLKERNMHFWDVMYNTIPELGMSYPGQKLQWIHSQEFFFLKKCIITDHNMNLLGCAPMRRMLVWGPFSYYENRLRRHSLLMHPDDPILALADPTPALEDKPFIVYSHRNCVNAGFLFANIMGLKAETRFGILPNHHTDAIGAVVGNYAALTSGSVLVTVHDNLFTDEHCIAVLEKMCVEEVQGLMGTKADFDHLLRHAGNFERDQFEHMRWIALFENATDAYTPKEYLEELKKAFYVNDVFVFRGTAESSYMVSYRSLAKGEMGLVPHTQVKVTGDRGTKDAKILSRSTRGNLKLRGPHVAPYYYSNAGLMTEFMDDQGWVSTSRDGVIDSEGKWTAMAPQTY
eukprot:PhM_4_TR12032/c0_g1_i1/m.100856/K00666/K00666; fatty-acyl-CoA synthase